MLGCCICSLPACTSVKGCARHGQPSLHCLPVTVTVRPHCHFLQKLKLLAACLVHDSRSAILANTIFMLWMLKLASKDSCRVQQSSVTFSPLHPLLSAALSLRHSSGHHVTPMCRVCRGVHQRDKQAVLQSSKCVVCAHVQR